MAHTEKQGTMVLREEDMTGPTLAPLSTSANSPFVVLKQGHSGDTGKDKGSLLALSEANNLVKSAMSSAATGIHPTSSTSLAGTDTTTHPEILPADARCQGITVTLDNNSMWNEFYRCQTEMILTKQGRRMFPYCRFRLSGMEPFQSYSLAMDIVPVDNHRYKWIGKGWETNGKADSHVLRLCVHPKSPATGLHWMQYPISFYRLKLCNNTLDQEGHIILHSMQRYRPRLHIIPADKPTKDIQIDRPDVMTFSFSQTEFFAVTAYQSLHITQLKIDYNPFAKGFREDAVNARSLKAKNGMSTEETENELQLSRETKTLNNLKTLFMKRSVAAHVSKHQNVPSQTNRENKALVVERDVTSVCTKKRPLIEAFSDFKGAHVKIQRLSLDNILQNGIVLQTACTGGKQELVTISSKPENVLQIEETMMEETLRCKNTDASSKTDLPETEENKMVIDEHKDNEISLLSSDQKSRSSDEKAKETLSSQDTETVSKKAVPHKRPEPVPLPLLAQFLKQRTSKTRPTTTKPDLMSSTPSATTHLRSQSLAAALPQTDALSSTADASIASLSSISLFSLSSTVAPITLKQTQKPLLFSPSPACDLFLTSNTTSPAKPIYDPATDSISDDAVSVLGLDNTLRSQSNNSSVVTCNVLQDTDISTTPNGNTVVVTPDTSTLTTSYFFDVPSSENIEVPPYSLSTHNDSLSLPLNDPSSLAFSFPSPASSSPDPFPPDLFCDRPVPPRKTLDSFPERLLDCTGIPSNPFTLGLFNDRPEPSRKTFDSFPGGLLDGPIASQDSLSPSLQNRSLLSSEPIDLFSQNLFSDRPGTVNNKQSAVNGKCSETTVSDYTVFEQAKQSVDGSNLKKSNKKQKRTGKLKHNEDDMFEGAVPAPMQPSLEDVEGQLFVSFMSKTALDVHLGDDAKLEAAQTPLENSDGESRGNVEENFEGLEKDLLCDLKMMRHRQVIHPVLQKVGLKLNLVDLTLAIDLQYLGVQLPIPPPALTHEASSASSQVQSVSRTGKTTDITKIKGWREKFAGSSSTSEGVSGMETGQNNLSAFCSDMLDEYLASEGKLIDERAANLSQTDTTSVAYQLPIKSTSYVRTLDSVLKKQVSSSVFSTSTHLSPTSKVKPTFNSKIGRKSKRYLKSGKGKQALHTTKPAGSVDKLRLNIKKSQQSKRTKIMKESKRIIAETPAGVSDNTPKMEVSGSTAVSSKGGRSPGLPKTLVKLMDVEDGAVWEGKHRTCITEERAAIALAALVTIEGASKGNPDAFRIIKRRAPPCLNIFCRLGCVCASLLHLRRHHHCGKPECMLGCSCLRRKVIALKTPKDEESPTEEPEEPLSEEDKAKWKKNRKRTSYILTDPEATPEPAKRVSTLWDLSREDSDSEDLFAPPSPRVPSPAQLSEELPQDLENLLSPSRQKRVAKRNLNMIKDSVESSQTSARVRAFCWSSHNKQKTPVDQHHVSQVSTQDTEEGELVPLHFSGPTKCLEVVSECSWSSTDSRDEVMRIVCEHMAQDRLKHPFWVGKYYIQPLSETLQEMEDGSVHTYKVSISQPVEKNDDEKVTHSDSESRPPVEKIEVKGLPFLSRCSPAGLLKAEIKAPDAPGHIMVNGRLYPKAKLELGKMGSLHPANRLAAYITGRICPVSQSGSSMVTTATTSKAPAIVPVTNVAKVRYVSSPSPPTLTPIIKTKVPTPPVGQVFTQFVVKHIKSQNLPSTSGLHLPPPKIIIPPSVLMGGREAEASGVVLSPVKPGLVSQVSEPSKSTGSISCPTISKIQPPIITGLSKLPGLPLGGCTAAPVPISSGSPPSGNKKVLITVVSRITGSTSSAPQIQKSVTQIHPPQSSGQKMMLQVMKTADGSTLYRNPSGQLIQLVPLSQIQSLKPNILSQGPTNAVSVNKPQRVTLLGPADQTQAKTTFTLPTSSLSMSSQPVTLTASKSVSFNSLPSTLKVSPSFLGQSGTCTLRILPSNTVKDPEVTTQPLSSSFSRGHFTLLNLASLMPQNQDSTKSEVTVSVGSESTDNPVGSAQMLLDLSKPSVRVHDSTVSEHLTEDASQVSGDTSRPACSEPGELDVLGLAANSSVNKIEFDTNQEDGRIDLELTDDSDLYSEDDMYSDSDKEDQAEDGLDSEMKDYAEVMVDIETVEESAEKQKIAQLRASASSERQHQSLQKHTEDVRKDKKVVLERVRRSTLRECFLQLQTTLNKTENLKISKMSILTLAQEEIEHLVEQEHKLVERRDSMRLQKERYLQTLSILSDTSVESISQKLNEIMAKQKALEDQNKATEMKSQQMMSKPKLVYPSSKPKINDSSSPTQSPSKPIDLSLKKRRSQTSQETSETVTDYDYQSTSKPAVLESRNTPTNQGKERVCIPQVIPLMNTVVPHNQIITINNPLQPINITSLGAQQTSTPGIASMSVPSMFHPLGAENPLQMLQPMTNSSVQMNTAGESDSPLFISNIISLVPSVRNLVAPQQAGNESTASVVQTPLTSVPAPVDNLWVSADVTIPHLEGSEAAEHQPKHGDECEVGAFITSSKPDELHKQNQKDCSDSEDEHLMSLLDELVLLSQQLSDDPPDPPNEEDGQQDTQPGEEDNQAHAKCDDVCALSPLLPLTLDEDLSPDGSKDGTDDIPPKVGSPSVSESVVTAASMIVQSPSAPACSDAPSPPPLLYMKAACGAAGSVQPAGDSSNTTWRPLPKLVPLGLKGQDGALNKTTGSSVLKADSKMEDVSKPHM